MEEKEDLGDPTEEPYSESESDVDEIINGDVENDEELDKSSTKKLFAIIGIIIAVIVIIIGSFYIYNTYFTPTGAATIDDLHELNVEGDESAINYVYNGYSFVFIDGLWYTQVQHNGTIFDIPLHFGPRDLGDIEISGSIDERFMKDEVYITFNATEKELGVIALSAAELSLNLVKGLGIKPIAACLNNDSSACHDRPIITCESEEATIYVKQAEEAKIVLRGNCIIIQGNEYELVKAADRFLLQWYNIMQ